MVARSHQKMEAEGGEGEIWEGGGKRYKMEKVRARARTCDHEGMRHFLTLHV